MNIKTIVIGGAVLGVAVGTYLHVHSDPFDVNNAVGDNYVTLVVRGGKSTAPFLNIPTYSAEAALVQDASAASASSGSAANAENPTSIHVTVYRTGAAPKNIIFAIPCGMVVVNGAPDGQRLMVARSVNIAMGSETSYASVQVETYCIDQFDLAPTPSSPLSFQPISYSRTDELNPVRKLAIFLSVSGLPYNIRQNAIWLYGGGFPDKTASDAYTVLYHDFYNSLRSQLDDNWNANKENLVQAMVNANPTVARQDAEDAIAEEYEHGADKELYLVDRAKKLAVARLDDFLGPGRETLVRWDPSFASKPLFNSPRPQP